MPIKETDLAVELIGITKYFPGTIANHDVYLKIKKGEVVALLGENGAGKSTLMKILYGMYHPDSGSIKVNGKDVNTFSTGCHGVGDWNDSPAFYVGSRSYRSGKRSSWSRGRR